MKDTTPDITFKASSAWGDGPDVLVTVERYGQKQWFDLSCTDAEELAEGLEQSMLPFIVLFGDKGRAYDFPCSGEAAKCFAADLRSAAYVSRQLEQAAERAQALEEFDQIKVHPILLSLDQVYRGLRRVIADKPEALEPCKLALTHIFDILREDTRRADENMRQEAEAESVDL